MSVYQINKLCHRLLKNHAFRAAMQADVASAIADLPLTDAERAALIAGDVATLHRMGASDFLLYFLTRFEIAGLTLPVYNQRIRALAEGESSSA
jgi:ethanolamine utilization microcompartment shell protein EutS